MNRVLRNVTGWYFSKNALPYWFVLFFDLAMVFASGLIVFFAYHRTGYNINHFWGIIHSILIYVGLSLIGFRLFRTYSGVMRYSSFIDLQRVALANIVSLVIAIIVHYPLYKLPDAYFEPFRLRHLVVMYVVATMLMWAGRVLAKSLFETAFPGKGAKNVFVYGVREGGIGVAKTIRNESPQKFKLQGFISHDSSFHGHLLMGVRVHQVDDDLPAALIRYGVEAVLVSPQRNNLFRNDARLQHILTEANVKIYMSEGYTEGTPIESIQLKEVSIDDLLPRDEIKVDMEKVGEMLTGRRILITGSAGSIGSEMVRQIAQYNPAELMLIDQAETPQHDIRLETAKRWPDIKVHTVVTSICRQDRMEKVFADFRPDYVFHAAAYKHVPMMEDNPSEAIQNNVQGTKILADLSVKYGVKKFVMVSTDKAVNPTNVMGCSKRICEIYVQALDSMLKKKEESRELTGSTQFVTTRFGNVLGSNGSVIPLFERQIKAGGPVTVTDPNIIRYFMLIPEACKLVLEAGTMGNGGEIFVFDMGKPVRIADLAKRMISLSGAKNVEVTFTGLRPGEKLYEEMLSTEENTKPSFHEKIRIAAVREYDFNDVDREISELIALSRNYDDMATVKKMKEIVPEYKSQNSIYEKLDNN